jgi:hypothetical protein
MRERERDGGPTRRVRSCCLPQMPNATTAVRASTSTGSQRFNRASTRPCALTLCYRESTADALLDVCAPGLRHARRPTVAASRCFCALAKSWVRPLVRDQTRLDRRSWISRRSWVENHSLSVSTHSQRTQTAASARKTPSQRWRSRSKFQKQRPLLGGPQFTEKKHGFRRK